MAQPMFFAFEEQNFSDKLSDQHMWGEDLLVAPIWKKKSAKKRHRTSGRRLVRFL
jgi:alpha-glucosidase (family GH31 glycosyl hydrolase)